MTTLTTRRRFLAISAASAAFPAHATPLATARWKGRALGAETSVQLVGLDEKDAAPIFTGVEAELTRLERVFSLYDNASELSRLNRDGKLEFPSPDLLEVLSLSNLLHRLSGGAFDPTIQPLWLARAGIGNADQAAALVGWNRVQFNTRSVTLDRPGMALTLNGIAQGAVTDRITSHLARMGLRDIAVDMGEMRVLGAGPGGDGWRAGVKAPNSHIVTRVTLRNEALATSAPLGTRIGPDRNHPHIVNPTGAAPAAGLVSVAAPSAAIADGLSTTLCMLTQADAPGLLAQFSQARVVWWQ